MMTFTELLHNEMEVTVALFRESDSEAGITAKEKLAQLRPILNGSLLDSCVTPFADAEMNFRINRERGLGRTSMFVLRFGGHFRKRMSRLDSARSLSALKATVLDSELEKGDLFALSKDPNQTER